MFIVSLLKIYNSSSTKIKSKMLSVRSSSLKYNQTRLQFYRELVEIMVENLNNSLEKSLVQSLKISNFLLFS